MYARCVADMESNVSATHDGRQGASGTYFQSSGLKNSGQRIGQGDGKISGKGPCRDSDLDVGAAAAAQFQ